MQKQPLNALKSLREEKQIPRNEMVKVVKDIYPGYDRRLQVKAENSHYFGIKLCEDALEALYGSFAPEKLKKPKKKCNRTLPRYVRCRVSLADHEAIKHCLENEGYLTMQDWLYSLIKNHLKAKGVTND